MIPLPFLACPARAWVPPRLVSAGSWDLAFSSTAARIASRGAVLPVQRSNDAAPCATRISSPSTTVAPLLLALREEPRAAGPVDHVHHKASGTQFIGPERAGLERVVAGSRVPTDVQLTTISAGFRCVDGAPAEVGGQPLGALAACGSRPRRRPRPRRAARTRRRAPRRPRRARARVSPRGSTRERLEQPGASVLSASIAPRSRNVSVFAAPIARAASASPRRRARAPPPCAGSSR